MKRCTICHKEQPLTEFHWRNKANSKRHGRCRMCKHKIDNKAYRTNHKNRKQQIRTTRKSLLERNRKFILDYKSNHPCVDCGESDPIVLDFDHLRDKEAIIAHLVVSGCSIERIQKEIDKCEIRCANCHRRITHLRRLSSAR